MNFDEFRQLMLEHQIIARGITDERVISALKDIPRHRFVPKSSENESYDDCPLPIGNGQTISQPYIVALMTENLRLAHSDRVLEVGTGSGYQTAILSKLCKQIYTVERIDLLLEKAKVVFKDLGISNITSKIGDGTLGWEENAPYEAIIVTAASADIPPPLIEQLKDGGRLVIPVGSGFGQVLTLIGKKQGRLQQKDICACSFVPLIGRYGLERN